MMAALQSGVNDVNGNGGEGRDSSINLNAFWIDDRAALEIPTVFDNRRFALEQTWQISVGVPNWSPKDITTAAQAKNIQIALR